MSNLSNFRHRKGFFDLPIELRIAVYDAYFSSQARSFRNTNQVLMTVTHFPCSALLRTCRKIAREVQQQIDFGSRLQILARLISNPKATINIPSSVRTIKNVELTQHYGAVAKNELFSLADHNYARDIHATVDLVRSLRKAMPQLRTITITIMLPPSQKAYATVDAARLFLTGIEEVKQIELRLGSFACPCPMHQQNKLLAVWEGGVYCEATPEEGKPGSLWAKAGLVGRTLSM